MPGIEIEPLEDEHLAAAAALLADRHRRHRETEPLLPEVSDFRAHLESDLDHELASGVVALSGDDLVAYVIGRVEDDSMLGDRRAMVDFAGCAATKNSRRTGAISGTTRTSTPTSSPSGPGCRSGTSSSTAVRPATSAFRTTTSTSRTRRRCRRRGGLASASR